MLNYVNARSLRCVLSVIGLIAATCTLGACGASQPVQSVEQQAGIAAATETATSYDQNSWREIIPESCLHFTDGCNQCTRSAEGGVAACTRKACFKYEMPRCLDGVAQRKPDSFRKLHYSCDNGVDLWVFYDEYRTDDMRVKLTSEQVYLSDSSLHTAYLLTRVPSASGEKYTNGKITYFAKGSEAMVMEGDTKRHQRCTLTE
ncbi:MAG TPA: MliC family protein [Marinagarivorans sp.]